MRKMSGSSEPRNPIAITLISKFRSQQYNNTLQVLAQAGVTISGAAMLWLGTLEVMQGKLSIGALIAIMAVAWRVLGPIQTVFLSMHRIKTIIGTIRQLDRLIKIRPEREPGRITGAALALSGQMSLAGVCFRYANRSDLTIKGISLDIKAGEFITITGPSGAGKSTLLKIMLGLYQSQSGSVRLDDLDLRQIDPAELRQRLSFLGQDPAFFYGTVAQNLRLAAADSTDAELVARPRERWHKCYRSDFGGGAGNAAERGEPACHVAVLHTAPCHSAQLLERSADHPA